MRNARGRSKPFRRAIGVFTIIAIMVSIGVIAAITAYYVKNGGLSKLLFSSKTNQLIAVFQNVKTAQMASYRDTGFFAGMTLPSGALYPFPDGLLYKNAVPDEIKPRWKGPYLKTAPKCPFSGCTIDVDFNTGAARNLGEVAEYFIVAHRVPIQYALDISRKFNGDNRVQECTTGIISDVVAGNAKPCVIYLSTVTGAPNTPVDVYYTFFQYTY